MYWFKNNWIKVALGVLILVVFFSAKGWVISPVEQSPSPSASPTDIADLADAIKKVESEQPSRMGDSPTEDEIYNSPFVKHIRVALNGYLDGSNKGIDDPDYTSNGSDEMPNCGLNKFDKSYYQSKFIIYGAGDNDYGGIQANIVFVNKPDTIFWAWVYKLGGGDYTLRGFCSNGPTEENRADFTDYIQKAIKGSKFSL